MKKVDLSLLRALREIKQMGMGATIDDSCVPAFNRLVKNGHIKLEKNRRGQIKRWAFTRKPLL